MKNELLKLTRQLRSRLETSHESDFAMGSGAKPKSASETMKSSTKSVAVPPSKSREPFTTKAAALAALSETVAACRLCPLGSQRLTPVFGVGSADAEVMFIGEGPGREEDHRGEPFVGKSGQLLDRIFESIGLSRQSVYIANIVKCHPMKDPSDPEARDNDRKPSPSEIEACRAYLDQQIRIIAPKVIVTLGAVPAAVLLPGDLPITQLRGQWREYHPSGGGASVKVLPTFHPAALLRNPNLKKDVWTDMKNLRAALGAP